MLDSKTPSGELANKWSDYKSKVSLVSPSNKQNIDFIITTFVQKLFCHLKN